MHVNQLLNEISTISKSYKRVAEATGENFNLFTILDAEANEVKTHSRFLGELLNRRGSHGQKDGFLKSFLKYFQISNFDSASSQVTLEYFIGKISSDFQTGGRIDILIKDKQHNIIMIENKIYAADQTNQLARYQTAFPGGRLFYLTLFSEKGEKKKSYDVISYENDIINWLEECKMISTSVPILRESISQYINLLKKLTNQNQNKKMSQEIAKRVLQDRESFKALRLLVNSKSEVVKTILNEEVFPFFETLADEYDLTLKIDKEKWVNQSGNWTGLQLTNDLLRAQNLSIGLLFNSQNGLRSLIFGFKLLNNSVKQKVSDKTIINGFRQLFGGNHSSKDWPVYQKYSEYYNWDTLEVMEKIKFGNFKDDFTEKVSRMLDLSNLAPAVKPASESEVID